MIKHGVKGKMFKMIKPNIKRHEEDCTNAEGYDLEIDGQRHNGVSSPCTLTGLVNNHTYSITVIAFEYGAFNVRDESSETTSATPRASLNVHFDTDGGTEVASVTGVKYGTQPSLPGNPTKLGFNFWYWYISDENSPWYPSSIFEDTYLTAKWDPQIVKMEDRSLANGVFENAYSASVTAKEGSGDYSYSGGGFPEGITISEDGKITGDPTEFGDYNDIQITVYDNITDVSAVGYYTLSIVEDGPIDTPAPSIAAGAVENKDEVNFSTIVTDTDKHITTDKGETLSDNSYTITEDVTLSVYATKYGWKDSLEGTHSYTVNKYGVTYLKGDKATGTAPVDLNEYKRYESATTEPIGDVENKGYKFVGWETTNSDGETNTFDENEPVEVGTEDIVFVADWEVVEMSLEDAVLTAGKYDEPYDDKVAASGGSEEFKYTGSGLPSGLSLGDDGTTSGTPTEFGEFTLTITAKDVNNEETDDGEFTLTIDSLGMLEMVEADVPSGEIDKGDNVNLFTSQEGATIIYTTDGTIPSASYGTVSSSIIIDKDMSFDAIAIKDGWEDSEVSEFSYTLKEYSLLYDVGTIDACTKPSDSNKYNKGDVTYLLGKADMIKLEHTFKVWDVLEVTLNEGSAVNIETSDVTAEAVWEYSETEDTDSDGYSDVVDEYPMDNTKSGVDLDDDGVDDLVDPDRDNDGIPDKDDLYPDDETKSGIDTDSDGIDDAIDDDDDGDGVLDEDEADTDGDGVPNERDDDIDNDMTINGEDMDVDGDGSLNIYDDDVDGDLIEDKDDSDSDSDKVLDANEADTDADGVPNENDGDIDGDGISNIDDDDIDGDDFSNDVDDDIDGDGILNSSDMDADGDCVLNEDDTSPNGFIKSSVGPSDGDDTNLNIDTDDDAIPDLNIDVNDDGKADLNIDTNGDMVPDTNIDTDGDGIADKNIDSDGDGVADTNLMGYEVTFDSKGGSHVESEMVLANTQITEPSDVQREGYFFRGWYVDEDYTTKWDFESLFEFFGDMTLYAKWERISEAIEVDPSDTKEGDVSTIVITEDNIKDIIESGSDRISFSVNNKNKLYVNMNLQTIKDLGDKKMTIHMQKDEAIYKIASESINVEDVASRFEKGVEYSGIMMSFSVENISGKEAALVQKAVESSGSKSLMSPAKITIKGLHKGKEVEVDEFSRYFTYYVKIPDDMDVRKVNTATLLTENGELRHVPTKILKSEGQNYVQIKSLSSGIFTIIESYTLDSGLGDYWTRDYIEEMAMRKIIDVDGKKMDDFDEEITRGEFSMIIVRGLGMVNGVDGKLFSDVGEDNVYKNYIQMATKFSLINGYGTGEFKPGNKITREEAMTIIVRAMKLTGIPYELTKEQTTKNLNSFADSYKISDYAGENVARCLEAGIVNGRIKTEIDPKGNITISETIVMIKRLLEKSDFIN